MKKERIIRYIALLCRLLVGLTFSVSGYVKAIDPLGTQYKITDYLGALSLESLVPQWMTLMASLTVSTLEFCLGILLLVGIRRDIVTRLSAVFMCFMTLVTLWIFLFTPVRDCGCFGDAIRLTNGQTLAKNILLLASTVFLWRRRDLVTPLLPHRYNWIVTNAVAVVVLGTSAWSLYDLPIVDFRPYKVGVNIRKSMEIPPGSPQPKLETYFILEKEGKRQEFTLENYPDSTWTFIDSRTVELSSGYVPPISDFAVTDRETGEDVTDGILGYKGYTYLLVCPRLEDADDSAFGEIDAIYENAMDKGWRFYCLTSSGEKGIENWRDITGARYDFLSADATVLKTMIRSNPGLILLKDGTILGKWSHNRLEKVLCN